MAHGALRRSTLSPSRSVIGQRGRAVVISTPRIDQRGSVTRVTADVAGTPLWFESSDASVVRSSEAFASALLLPALHANRTLVLEGSVSETWRNNVAALLAIWHQWWGYQERTPVCDTRADVERTHKGAALLFSGGVDSFYSILAGPRPEYLVAVHGFDIDLNDTESASALESALRDTAAAQDCTPVFIRTNLRDHPASGKRPLWNRAHGGALAAIGHLLSDRIDQLVVSSSYSDPVMHAWGSTPQTDSLLAGDGFSIVHFGGELQREDRVGAIANHPLVKKHLRVCWKNKPPGRNCSRCEKCVIAMMHLAEHGALDNSDRFDRTSVLAERIDQLPLVHREFNVMSRIAARGRLDANAAISLANLLRRSRRAAPLFALKERLASGDRAVIATGSRRAGEGSKRSSE